MTETRIALLPDRGVVSVAGRRCGEAPAGRHHQRYGPLSTAGRASCRAASRRRERFCSNSSWCRQPERLLPGDGARQGGRAGRAPQDVQAARRRRRSRTCPPTTRWRPSGAAAHAPHGVGRSAAAVRRSTASATRLSRARQRCAPTGRSAASRCEQRHAGRLPRASHRAWACRRAARTTPSATRSRTRRCSTSLNGVSFEKGCYVGQEVVSRMQNRGTARKRVVPVVGDAARCPHPGPRSSPARWRSAGSARSRATAGSRCCASTARQSSRQRARRCAPAPCRVRIDLPDWAHALAPEAASHAP